MTDGQVIVAALAAAAVVLIVWGVVQLRRAEAEATRRRDERRRQDEAKLRPAPAEQWPARSVGQVPPHRMPPSPVPRTARSFTASPTPTRRDDDDAGSALLAMSMLNSHSPAMPFAYVPSDPAPYRSGGGGDYGGGGASASWDSGSSCSSSDSSSSSSDSSSCSSSD